jgi:hypothetical protein
MEVVQKPRVQGARKVQGQRVYNNTREFELFDATPQSGDFQQPEAGRETVRPCCLQRLESMTGGG